MNDLKIIELFKNKVPDYFPRSRTHGPRYQEAIRGTTFNQFKSTTQKQSNVFHFQQDAAGHLDHYLSKNKYAAGDHLTIADLCLLASAATMEAVDAQVFANQPNIRKWLDMCRKEVDSYQELNQEGANAFGQMAKVALAKNH